LTDAPPGKRVAEVGNFFHGARKHGLRSGEKDFFRRRISSFFLETACGRSMRTALA
jgi:hypothetical protein